MNDSLESTILMTPQPCADCGKPLPASAPGGICPRCALTAAIEVGSTPRPGFDPDSLLSAPPKEDHAPFGDYDQLTRVALSTGGGAKSEFLSLNSNPDRGASEPPANSLPSGRKSRSEKSLRLHSVSVLPLLFLLITTGSLGESAVIWASRLLMVAIISGGFVSLYQLIFHTNLSPLLETFIDIFTPHRAAAERPFCEAA
jgi:hypothetical protein